MNIDDILQSVYTESQSLGNMMRDETKNKRMEVCGSGKSGMSLEDFLAEAAAVNKEDVGVSPPPDEFGMMESSISAQGSENPDFQLAAAPPMQKGRGKSRGAPQMDEVPLDKITLQKQRRMIKNRESAARSRQRKQAYTMEMETLVAQLEEDNAKLLKQEAKLNRKRYKQLMENLIPVTEQRPPPRVVLRRVRSLQW